MSSFPLVSAYSHIGLYIYNAHKKHPFLEILIILSASRSPDQQPLCLSSLQSISPASAAHVKRSLWTKKRTIKIFNVPDHICVCVCVCVCVCFFLVLLREFIL